MQRDRIQLNATMQPSSPAATLATPDTAADGTPPAVAALPASLEDAADGTDATASSASTGV